MEQLRDNLASLEVDFSAEQLHKLNEASRPEGVFFSDDLKRMVFGGHEVTGWR